MAKSLFSWYIYLVTIYIYICKYMLYLNTTILFLNNAIHWNQKYTGLFKSKGKTKPHILWTLTPNQISIQKVSNKYGKNHSCSCNFYCSFFSKICIEYIMQICDTQTISHCKVSCNIHQEWIYYP